MMLASVAAVSVLSACGGNARRQKTENRKMEVKELTRNEFLDRVYNYEKYPGEWRYEGDRPALIDFYATWCGPCKAMAPIVEDMAGAYGDRIAVYKVDVDKEPELAAAFGIRSIPTFYLIPMSGKPTIIQGAMSKQQLAGQIDHALLNKSAR